MKKIKQFTLFFFILGISLVGRAQEKINLNVVNSTGTSVIIKDNVFDFSLGEILIQTYNFENFSLSQGFLQPYSIITSEALPGLRLLNNMISPNGDGKNDVLKFDGLEEYKDNKLTIIDRSGRIIYVASPYNNNWEGILNGKILAEDTYYWQLEVNGSSKIKGFVSIVYDKF